ncbi:ECF transporter S component [Dolosicoccus paucivorans]|uniref:ECF transporter S component n=1 Tax=Dolosicoccus paucivorans TaxID=84521 RepID=UPI000884EFB1|nr:ECF transporter S component [Dolosicoccus paucivorans]SDI49721.1 Uncharacterized membrane protein [Dolosicoccus paucivorans]
MKKSYNSTFPLIEMALYAALVALSVLYIRIPIPSPNNHFIHPGNALVALSILLMGFRRGSIAGIGGLVIFDIIAGYYTSIPKVIIESLVTLLVMQGVYQNVFRKRDTVPAIATLGVVAGVTKVAMIFLMQWLTAIIVSQMTVKAAAIYAFSGLTAGTINAVATSILVPVLYFLLKPIVERYHPVGE